MRASSPTAQALVPGLRAIVEPPTLHWVGRGSFQGAGTSRTTLAVARRESFEKVYGLHAVLALHARRPADVLQIAHTRERRSELAALLRDAASRRLPYNEVTDEELTRIADAVHHEGVCVQARPRPLATADALAAMLRERRGAAVALDRIGNPHNLGAVLRSAAFFGFDGALLGAEPEQAKLGPAAVRVAEGGAEWLAIARATTLADGLATLRASGVQVVGADARADATVFGFAWARPCVVVVGNERTGLSPAVRRACTALVRIPGSGAAHVDSLNASVAAAVVLAEVARSAH